MPDISYTLRRTLRTRRIRLSVYPDGRVVVAAPRFVSLFLIQRFVRLKTEWIKRKQGLFAAERGAEPIRPTSRKTYPEHKEAARSLVHSRLEELNQRYGFSYKKVFIKNQKTCWGSCSKKGNLNFNYRLVFLPSELIDYVLVHELCHLKEMNHSFTFWRLVAQTLPQYPELRRELRRHALRLM